MKQSKVSPKEDVMRLQIWMSGFLVASFLLFSATCPDAVVAQESADDERVAEIIDAYIEALGGRMSVETASLKIIGTNQSTSDGADGEADSDVIIHYMDGLFGFEMTKREDASSSSFYAFDNTSQWNMKNGKTETGFVNENDFGWMKAIPFVAQQALHWQEWGKEVTRKEDTTFLEQEVAAIEIQLSDSRNTTHYFSKESGLLIGSKLDKGSSNVVHYEYTEIEGMQCISAVIIKDGRGAKGVYDFKFQEFDFEATFTDEVFKRPAGEPDLESDKDSDEVAGKGSDDD